MRKACHPSDISMNQACLAALLATLLLAACQPSAVQAPAQRPQPAQPAVDNVAEPVPSAQAKPEAPAEEASTLEENKAVNQAIDRLLGDHRSYQRVIEEYQRAVAANDRATVAALVRYPLIASMQGRRVSVADPVAFLADYDRILTPEIARAVVSQRYGQLMVNGQGVMFGNGESWIGGICKPGSNDCSEFEVKVIAIQPGGVP